MLLLLDRKVYHPSWPEGRGDQTCQANFFSSKAFLWLRFIWRPSVHCEMGVGGVEGRWGGLEPPPPTPSTPRKKTLILVTRDRSHPSSSYRKKRKSWIMPWIENDLFCEEWRVLKNLSSRRRWSKKFVLNSWNSGRVLSSAVFLSFCRLESELTEYFFSSIHSVVVSSSPHLTQPPWRCFFTGTSLVKPSCPCKFTPSACRIVDDRRTMLARWLSRTEVTAATGSARVSLVD